MKKVKSIYDVDMGDILLYKNVLGVVSFFADDTMVILETLHDVEVSINGEVATMDTGSDQVSDVLECYMILRHAETQNPIIEVDYE